MFWGLTLKPNKRYYQTLKNAFHLSNAALDVSSCQDEGPVQVTVIHDNNKHIICTLRKNKVEQVPLSFDFSAGDKISFSSEGNGSVHLTGNLIFEEDFYSSDSDEDAADVKELPKKENANKKKGQKNANNINKLDESTEKEDDDEEDDEDNSDINEFEDDEDDDEDDDDDDEGEEEEDNSEDEDDDESSDEEDQEPRPKQIKLEGGKQNGLENGKVDIKSKKNKQKQEQNKKNQHKKPEQAQAHKPQQEISSKGGEKTLAGGVKIEDIQIGAGPEAKPGKKVFVYYEGKLKQNNKVFDQKKDGKPFKFALGKGDVIKAWDIGIAGMKTGGKRRISCPPHMAYGAKGRPPVIPPNSSLIFDVELKSVN